MSVSALPPADSRPRIEDVAARAGTSAITVSRTLRQPEKVAEATRARVRLAIEQMGYIPDLAARSLASRRTGFVAVLVPTIANPVFAATVQGVADALHAEGLQLLLGDYGYSGAREHDLLRALAGRRPEGVIAVGLVAEPAARGVLRALGVPVVETWDLTAAPLDTVVGFSNAAAGAAMARHFAAGGCRHFGFIGGANDRSAARGDGFAAAAAALGLPAPVQVEVGPSRLAEGAAGLARLLDRAGRTDAVFSADDVLAAGALLECQRRGIDVPGRIAIGGLGDMELARALPPGLTTIDVAAEAIGRAAARAVLARRRGAAGGPAVQDLGFTLIARGSTRPAPA